MPLCTSINIDASSSVTSMGCVVFRQCIQTIRYIPTYSMIPSAVPDYTLPFASHCPVAPLPHIPLPQRHF
ncbi:hypothetical protein EV356DRAFT_503660 [Viridothelium virens]|uniref:Uncharacterized protein n=1 Tax=Viridothelium virens TaxID=1048519 RepID=A0A6A6H5G2_VIRVR|nr:hypothetical protein EV356DRAFT_503660 [Viridothelium virens]